MIAGLIIKLTEGTFIQTTVSFNEGFFFNLLLPPIILASGYELHQVGLLCGSPSNLPIATASDLVRLISFETLEPY